MNDPDPLLCSCFVFLAFVLAGILQTVWLKSAYSKPFGVAIDGGLTLRGRRVFGDNKTWRGFVVMVPAVGLAFLLVRSLMMPFGELADGIWSLSLQGYMLLGCWAGCGFMSGELPNSFVKRQCDIAPGAAAVHPLARTVCFTVDQVDSIIGGLIAVSLVVPVPVVSWVSVLVVGALIHWGFNCVLMMIGLKARAA